MIINQKYILNLSTHLAYLPNNSTFVLGVDNIQRFREILKKAGFSDQLEIGETILPAKIFGRTSRFNAEGKFKVHRDQPKETAYRVVEWHWKEWRGRYDTEDKTDFVDVPYQRYPRTLISPPSLEMQILAKTDGEKIVVCQSFRYLPKNHEHILVAVNLFLELFGECQIFSEGLEQILKAPMRRLNWKVLPAGRYPWERLREHVDPVIKQAKEGNQKVITNRFETINTFTPEFYAIGQGGFRGYVVFGFPKQNIYILESIFTHNATYVFAEKWEDLSQMTKAQILDEHLQRERIIHQKGWHDHIKQLFR